FRVLALLLRPLRWIDREQPSEVLKHPHRTGFRRLRRGWWLCRGCRCGRGRRSGMALRFLLVQLLRERRRVWSRVKDAEMLTGLLELLDRFVLREIASVLRDGRQQDFLAVHVDAEGSDRADRPIRILDRRPVREVDVAWRDEAGDLGRSGRL